MQTAQVSEDISFLNGGGEMGELIRRHNWYGSTIGPPEKWPQSLRTTLSIVINSRFPMFLFWGSDLTCFYNDAFRPSLGNDGKHPSILGGPGEVAWAEIWPVIKPLLDQVLSGGEAIWRENQLIPFFRNGKIEDIYWTFSYSPVNDESGKPAGVFVTCSETTNQIRNLEQLTESRNELSFAIEATELGTFDYNPFTGKFSANQRLKNWFGLRPVEEIELTQAIASIAEGDRRRVTDSINRALEFESGGKFDIIYSIINPETKKTTVVQAKGKTWFNDEKQAYRFNGTIQDITQEYQARKTLDENEQKLNIIIDASELGTWELNLVTDYIQYSDRYKEIFGFRKEQQPGHEKMISQLYPEDRNIRNSAMKDAFKSGSLYYVSRVLWDDKSLHWIEVQGKVFYDENGKPLNLIGTVRDITESKNYQQVLQESEQKFRLLADSMPQFVWTGDPAGVLNYFNRAVYAYAGLIEEKINKEGWLQIVHPDERAKNIAEWTKSVAAGTDFIFEHRFRRHDGVYRWQLSRAIPQRDENGQIQMWVGTSTDIEDQKSFAEELERQVQERTRQLAVKNVELENRNKELQSFAYVSSHDLQEPLRKIQIFSDRIMETDRQNLSEEGKYSLSRMVYAAERMRKLIDDLLSYSRIASGSQQLERVNLNDILAEVKEDLSETIKEKNATIESRGLTDSLVIRFQFIQLFQNLISNSLKFASSDRRPHILISGESLPGWIVIHVADNGIGFEPEYGHRIFELFQRLHGNAEYSGTGVGLAIVKRVIDNHQGNITAAGTPGAGAVFTIRIPQTEKTSPSLRLLT